MGIIVPEAILPSKIGISNVYISFAQENILVSKSYNNTWRVNTNYNIFNDDNINLISDNDDIDIISRNKRILILNDILKKECLKYNINYCDIYDLITDNYVLNDIFYLKNPYNIHQKYEYLLFIYLFNCLYNSAVSSLLLSFLFHNIP